MKGGTPVTSDQLSKQAAFFRQHKHNGHKHSGKLEVKFQSDITMRNSENSHSQIGRLRALNLGL